MSAFGPMEYKQNRYHHIQPWATESMCGPHSSSQTNTWVKTEQSGAKICTRPMAHNDCVDRSLENTYTHIYAMTANPMTQVIWYCDKRNTFSPIKSLKYWSCFCRRLYCCSQIFLFFFFLDAWGECSFPPPWISCGHVNCFDQWHGSRNVVGHLIHKPCSCWYNSL